MNQKINFKWSWIYEKEYHYSKIKSEEFDYEKNHSFIKNYQKKINKEWEKVETKVFRSIEEITGLKFKEKKIDCYIIKRSPFFPISDPLTIPIEFKEEKIISLTPKRFIDMLVHEIIHILFIQNEKQTEKYFEKIFELYEKEEFNTVIHLIVHAIHKKIFLKIFNKKRLNKEISLNKYYHPYKRSWELVNKKGEDEVIKEFKKFI